MKLLIQSGQGDYFLSRKSASAQRLDNPAELDEADSDDLASQLRDELF